MNVIRTIVLLAGMLVGVFGLSSTAVAEGSFQATAQHGNNTDQDATPTNCGTVTEILKVTNADTNHTYTSSEYEVIKPSNVGSPMYVHFFHGCQPPNGAHIMIEGKTKEDGTHDSGGINWS